MDCILIFITSFCTVTLIIIIPTWLFKQYTLPSYWVAKQLIKVFKVKEPNYLIWVKDLINDYQYPIILSVMESEFIPDIHIYLYSRQIYSYKRSIKINFTYKDMLWISKWVGDHNNNIR